MAQNTMVALESETWTLLTVSNVTALRAQEINGSGVWLMATVGAVAPTGNPATQGALLLGPWQTLAADLTLAQLFPGIVGANRVYAYSGTAGSVSVSHA